MKCPYCGEIESQVLDTRCNEEGSSIRRRRRCPACEKRFTTYERIDLQLPYVIKKEGYRCEYDRDKLKASMLLALRKRWVAVPLLESALERIEEKLLQSAEREVSSSRLGELVMQELKKLDKVAYIRFASVYQEFANPDEFSKAIREVSSSKSRSK